MDNELFGDRHEEEEFGLHGRLHEEQQANALKTSDESVEVCEPKIKCNYGVNKFCVDCGFCND